MKRMLLPLITFFCYSLSAQIQISALVFPAAGDTLRFAFDNNPSADIVPNTPPGGPTTWDFTKLKFNQTNTTIYRPASQGINFSKFPGATLMTGANGQETFLRVTADKFEVMGFAGQSPVGFPISVVARFSPPAIERRAPLNFFDIHQQTTNLTIPFSAAALPDTLLSGLPFTPDSFRVRVNTARTDVVDSYGTCMVPNGSYPVLRQKRTEISETKFDAKVPFLGWLDITGLLAGTPFGGFVGADTTVAYRFLSGTEKEEIVVATMADALGTEVDFVRFKNVNNTSNAENLLAPGSPNIQAFPNPAVQWVRFDCSNLPPAHYSLKIFNVIGNVVWENQYDMAGNKSITVSLDEFKKGPYLYRLEDLNGRIIATKRLVVLKP
ncbi:MAG: T9SS type A sorting domain-containing protein [Saprospiraceae bacterium]